MMFAEILFVLLFLFAIFATVLIWIYSIKQVCETDEYSPALKLGWVAFITFAFPFSIIAWFIYRSVEQEKEKKNNLQEKTLPQECLCSRKESDENTITDSKNITEENTLSVE